MVKLTSSRLKVGIVGYGYWGPNIFRTFSNAAHADVVSVCDVNPAALAKVRQADPGLITTADFRQVTGAKDIDVVAVVTPAAYHYQIAKKALENGKHIFVEKPFTNSVQQAEKLIEIAERKKLTIMVDHTYLFTGAVRKTKQLIEQNVLGNIYYYDSTRVNLGLFQHDTNVVWDLATHDFSIMDHLLSARPVALSAHGFDHFKRNLENIAYITIYLEKDIIAHFNINWLSPVKIRRTLIGGDKKMLLWNDLAGDEKLKIYNRGVDVTTKNGVYDLLISYRSADMYSPRLDHQEPLQQEVAYFIDCLRRGQKPFNDGHNGLRIVRLLEKCDRSMKKNGKVLKI